MNKFEIIQLTMCEFKTVLKGENPVNMTILLVIKNEI